MVLGEDGRKMSKSLGNVISPEEIIEQYGADALRQWATTGVVGEDVAFSWKEIKSAYRFQQKFWSILRFATLHLKEKPECKPELLRDADRWILSKLMKLVKAVDEHMENYRFNEALKAIRSFTWYEFADNYLEIVKNRLYSGSEEEKLPAKVTLYKVMNTLIRLIAPITPFLAEECWHRLHEAIGEKVESVHLQSYPTVAEILLPLARCDKKLLVKLVEMKLEDENLEECEKIVRDNWDTIEDILKEAEKRGELIKEIVTAVRRFKHDRGLALNAPLKAIKIYVPTEVDTRDIAGAVNAEVELLKEMPTIEVKVKRLKPKFNILGPMFKEKAKELVKAVESLPDDEKLKLFKGESVVVSLDGKNVEVQSDWFDVEIEKTVKGEKVEVLETANAIVLVEI